MSVLTRGADGRTPLHSLIARPLSKTYRLTKLLAGRDTSGVVLGGVPPLQSSMNPRANTGRHH